MGICLYWPPPGAAPAGVGPTPGKVCPEQPVSLGGLGGCSQWLRAPFSFLLQEQSSWFPVLSHDACGVNTDLHIHGNAPMTSE